MLLELRAASKSDSYIDISSHYVTLDEEYLDSPLVQESLYKGLSLIL